MEYRRGVVENRLRDRASWATQEDISVGVLILGIRAVRE